MNISLHKSVVSVCIRNIFVCAFSEKCIMSYAKRILRSVRITTHHDPEQHIPPEYTTQCLYLESDSLAPAVSLSAGNVGAVNDTLFTF